MLRNYNINIAASLPPSNLSYLSETSKRNKGLLNRWWMLINFILFRKNNGLYYPNHLKTIPTPGYLPSM